MARRERAFASSQRLQQSRVPKTIGRRQMLRKSIRHFAKLQFHHFGKTRRTKRSRHLETSFCAVELERLANKNVTLRVFRAWSGRIVQV